jgi:prepilin-type N-terminal cleavage/methylation domain-containing protein
MEALRRSRSAADDSGFTLVEVVVTMVVMVAAFAIIGPILVSAVGTTRRLEASSNAVDEARLVTARLDRELRSAVCIAAPTENGSGNTLVFDTLAHDGPKRVTYRVDGGRILRQEGVGAEVPVATGVGDTTTAFHQSVTPLRTVVVDIPIHASHSATFHLRTTIAGRNAWRAC